MASRRWYHIRMHSCAPNKSPAWSRTDTQCSLLITPDPMYLSPALLHPKPFLPYLFKPHDNLVAHAPALPAPAAPGRPDPHAQHRRGLVLAPRVARPSRPPLSRAPRDAATTVPVTVTLLRLRLVVRHPSPQRRHPEPRRAGRRTEHRRNVVAGFSAAAFFSYFLERVALAVRREVWHAA